MHLIPECKYAFNFPMQIPGFWNASPGLAICYLLLSSLLMDAALLLPGAIGQPMAALGCLSGVSRFLGPVGWMAFCHLKDIAHIFHQILKVNPIFTFTYTRISNLLKVTIRSNSPERFLMYTDLSRILILLWWPCGIGQDPVFTFVKCVTDIA